MSNAEGSSSNNSSATGGNSSDIYKRHLRKTNSWHPAQQIQVKQNKPEKNAFFYLFYLLYVQSCPLVKGTYSNDNIEQDKKGRPIFFVCLALLSHPPLGKSSTCHTEGRKIEKKVAGKWL
jgi:hypothetical protein